MTQEEIDILNRELGNHLTALREERKVKQWEIAKECNTTKSTISRIENGHKAADIIVLQAYSRVLKIPLSTLVKLDRLEVRPSLNIINLLLSLSDKTRHIVYRIIYDIWDMTVKNKSIPNQDQKTERKPQIDVEPAQYGCLITAGKQGHPADDYLDSDLKTLRNNYLLNESELFLQRIYSKARELADEDKDDNE